MIAYTTVGSNDVPKACSFYDALFREVGIGRIMTMDNFVCWGYNMDQPMFCVCKPQNGEAATVGNGTMIALQMGDATKVRKLHAKALALGSKNEGNPGPRGPQFYCGYFRDLDGNKLNAFAFNK